MGKVLIIDLKGDFEKGFSVKAQISEDGESVYHEVEGDLPENSKIPKLLKEWQDAFCIKVKRSRKLGGRRGIDSSDCRKLKEELAKVTQKWLKSGGEWGEIREAITEAAKDEEIKGEGNIRIIVKTNNSQLQQIPWSEWDLIRRQTFQKAEVAISSVNFQRIGKKPQLIENTLRVLLVLGHNEGIDIDFDKQVWKNLKNLEKKEVEIICLNQPSSQELFEILQRKKGWHIFFFAGHSSSDQDGKKVGQFDINKNETLKIRDLVQPFSKAIEQGLQLAIFNSCDGLGLANQLAQLNLPQSIVMREIVTDQVAQEFLEKFLVEFSSGQSFYSSVRYARENLKLFERKYPGVSWLPIIYQNPAVKPIFWQPSNFSSIFNQVLKSWKNNNNQGVIYSAPSSAFLGGEHSVVFGHPAIYYPLPLRLYVHIETDRYRHQIHIEEYLVPDPKNIKNITNIENIDSYGDSNVSDYIKSLNDCFNEVIYPYLKEKTGFKMKVLSSFPIAVGLNSSGAFAVSFAQSLVDHYLDIEAFKSHFNLQELAQSQVTLLLAWAIGNCSHGNSSSGAGVHASFYGRSGRYPLIYCSSGRSRLNDKISEGWSPVYLGEREEAIANLSQIKTFVFDAAKYGYPKPRFYNITLLYSGIYSKTKQSLEKASIRRYNPGSAEKVRSVYEKSKIVFKDQKIRSSLDTHINEIIGKIYLNNNIGQSEKNEQLDCAYLELLADSLGNLCISLINSVLSNWEFVPDLMTSCQYLLSSLGYSHRNIEHFVARLQANAFEYEIENNSNKKLAQISAKFTGAGKGGDIIVFSLYKPEIHQELLEKTRNKNNVVHFDSYTMFSEEENASVEGVKQEKD